MVPHRTIRCWRWLAVLLVVGLPFSIAAAGGGRTGSMEGEGEDRGPPLSPVPVTSQQPRSDPLQRPIESRTEQSVPAPATAAEVTPATAAAPLGFTGPSGVAPVISQDEDFVPVDDRWRSGFREWDRYDRGHPPLDDYPFVPGQWWDPFNQNVLKGDYPILGQNTFLEVTAVSTSLFEFRQIPTATTPFESTANPGQTDFFGKPNQFAFQQYFTLSLDLFHGDASFKPVDWRIKLTPVFNVNYLAAEELAVVNPDVRKGTTRGRTWMSLEEWFAEAKIADLGPDYDFLSVRAGSQPFVSDFRGFIFSDTNRAIRLFGTNFSNRDQFNVIFFDQQEKDTNSDLNTFSERGQYLFIANYYHQDFLFPGYTIQGSVHYNHDNASFHFNKNDFLVRPDPVGTFQPHELDVVYLGLAGDGHIGRVNITNAFYWALGHDSMNPLANRPVDISAQMAALELSYDRDWIRFRSSFLYASGDSNINNGHATGFDSIMDNPNFAGGQFSFWQREAIPLLGVNLVNQFSLLPDLRASKNEGQSNFVNPGLFLLNFGFDLELTPKLKLVNNVNFLWFDKTNVLEQFVFQGHIDNFIGADLSSGLIYRPLLSNNIIVTMGVSALLPGLGFQELYNSFDTHVKPLTAAFVQMTLAY
jgi:hypothetical protein